MRKVEVLGVPRVRWDLLDLTRRPTRSGRRGRADRLQASGIPQTGGKVKEKLGKDAIRFSESGEIFIIQGKQSQKNLASVGERWERWRV